ncbi:MAG TPA: hypothetical protein VHC22_24250 [Pirellulales bacterium]|nr:hypothetical protein [Pirellulales bacterium]
MASGENQGLQIALIIFVMLTILLSVTTFMFFREYQEADERSRKDQADATKAAQQMREAVTDAEALKKVIGVGENTKVDEVKTILADDMKKFATTAPAESQFYHPALEFLANTLTERTAELVAARDTIQQVKDDREKVEKAKQEQVAAAEENARKAEADLASAKKEFDADRKRMQEEQADLARQLKEKNDSMTELAEKSKKTETELAAENKKLASYNTFLNQKNEELDPTSGFEVPDGKIVWVDQRSRSAYVNVGSSDGLKRQTLFSVVSGDENVGDDQKTKGRIEVTEILGPHFAEARIIEDRLIDPLVEGDKIYTPLWHPGRAESFGIIGKMDLDNDGQDDRDMVRDLIRLNGGTIDAEDLPDGKQKGELNLHTRYLIYGDPPDDVAEKAYTKLRGDAQKMGVRLLSVSKFLDQVGWKNQKQTIRFGRRGNANDVPADQPDGGRQPSPTGSVMSGFRPRRPLGSRGLGGIKSDTPATPATKKSAYGP